MRSSEGPPVSPIPKGSKQLAGGKRSATTGRPRESDIHPGGMTAAENVRADRRSCLLSSLRDVRTHISSFPVVALRLPPANCFDPFGMGDTGGPSEERNGKRMNTQVVFHRPRRSHSPTAPLSLRLKRLAPASTIRYLLSIHLGSFGSEAARNSDIGTQSRRRCVGLCAPRIV